MKFSCNWLAEFTGPLGISARELADHITLKTAEQEGVEPAGKHFERVVTARVLAVNGRVVTIDCGPELGERTVYCGAPNVKAGMVSAYVPSGTLLGGKLIGKAVVHGVESDGMLASGAELGLNRESEGILELDHSVLPGSRLPQCEPDHIIEIDNKSLTHRPDLWGHFGMAREVAAILNRQLKDPVDMALIPAGAAAPIQVEIEDTSLCPRYSALVFENVTVKPSPVWLQYRLESIGLNPINNIVDVTNYVMAELAQPMHAFDHDALQGQTIYARRGKPGEWVVALNKETYHVDSENVVIADGRGPVAIGGIIGGLDSGVTGYTRRIVLESANFHAGNIRKSSTRLKLRTDASMRFEKSQDPQNTVRGLARAIALLQIVSPGIRLVGGLADAGRPASAPPQITLPLDWLRRKLGRDVPAEEVRRILTSLQFGVQSTRPDVLHVTAPSWRATKDISIKDDLVEEVGRMIGYTSIPPASPLLPAKPPVQNPQRDYFHYLRTVATSQGFTEVYNYSFLSEEQLAEFGFAPDAHVRVTNPIASDQTHMRSSLLPGLVRNIRDNSRHLDGFRLFEIGFEIHKKPAPDLPDEVAYLGACCYAKAGGGEPELYAVRHLADSIVPGVEVRTAVAERYEHPVRAWQLCCNETVVGRIAELHPNVVNGRAAVLLLNLKAVQALVRQPVRHKPLRRFPTSDFDLSVVTALRQPVGDLHKLIASTRLAHMLNVQYVRHYAGPPLAEDRKSVSFRVTVGADDRTLSNDEINQVRSELIDRLKNAGYELRI
ncbi:MAG: phenylalanine--tRNA ligase subunit beta [Bryobacterales bacterium]|nr:phenylalanine--tRNA ligase subunit beta [Bryobacterales bacterium]